MKFSYVAETEKTKLVPIGIEDVSDTYVSWFKDPDVTRFLVSGSDQTHESVREYIKKTLEDPGSCMWKILYKEAGEWRHVGNAKLASIKWNHRNASMSYIIGDKTVWGKGIGTDVARLVTRFAFDELNLHKVYAAIVEENIGSRLSIIRVGYRVEAYLNEDGFINGKAINSIWYSIFKNDRPK